MPVGGREDDRYRAADTEVVGPAHRADGAGKVVWWRGPAPPHGAGERAATGVTVRAGSAESPARWSESPARSESWGSPQESAIPGGSLGRWPRDRNSGHQIAQSTTLLATTRATAASAVIIQIRVVGRRPVGFASRLVDMTLPRGFHRPAAAHRELLAGPVGRWDSGAQRASQSGHSKRTSLHTDDVRRRPRRRAGRSRI